MRKRTKRESHKKTHEILHQMFDELVADFIEHTGRLPSETTVMELIQWSHEQTKNPSEKADACK